MLVMKTMSAVLTPMLLAVALMAIGCGGAATEAVGVEPVQGAPVVSGQAPAEQEGEPQVAPAPRRPPFLPASNGVSVADGLVFAGQPTAEELGTLKALGYRVLDLRGENEDRGFDEAAMAAEISLNYENIPVDRAALEDEDVHAAFRRALNADDSAPLLVHCASANRVAGLYYAMLVEDRGVPRAEALAQAEALGLTSPGVKSGIDAYLDR